MDLAADPYELLARAPDPTADPDEWLIALLPWALVAPSPHNTQPWRWSVADGVVELYADRTRTLSVSDADGRELTIGCGAALEQYLLRLALDRDRAAVTLLPDPEDPDLLARVDTTGGGDPLEPEPELVDAIPLRRTNRSTYFGPLPDALLETLRTESARLAVDFHVPESDEERAEIVELVMHGDREQMHNTDFRHELASWIRPAGTHQRDGMPADLLGQHGIAAKVAPLVVRTFDVGKGQAAKDRSLLDGSPAIVVLSSDTDDAAAWMRTGRALARVTLRARALDVWSAFMNQPCEVPTLRAVLRAALRLPGHPQLILRLGRAGDVHPSARRSIAEVLIPDHEG